ncbi:MAG: hypothetical protein C0475_05090 [Planctomyces sp.]|nr:hypothetical protein [Planctomyces sp.]MBA4039485.1 hypothetical protein [Planctomyces sp.]MBA4119790.1 hypothetical protein [Isosphaera sp.]
MNAAAAQDDPFGLLGLPATMDLDAAHVESAYLARARLAHPDHAPAVPPPPTPPPSPNTPADPHARPAPAVSTTAPPNDDGPIAALNEARRTLRDPVRRAGALLRVLGGPGPEGDRSVPTGFLQELMDTRERIEAERASAGGALPGPAVDRWLAWAERRRAELLQELRRALAGAAPGDAATLGRARQLLNALRSVERTAEQLDADPA